MLATWFPFTVVRTPMLGLLPRCFSRTVVYRPMAGPLPGQMAAAVSVGWLEVRVPFGGDDGLLARQIDEFQQWGGTHRDTGLTALAAAGSGNPSLWDPSPPSAIQSAVRRHAAGLEIEDTGDPVARARLFLGLAEAFDLQAAAMEANLASMAGLESVLMRQIHGDSAPAEGAMGIGSPLAPPPDPGRHMTAARLTAWARLVAADPAPGHFIVTDSPAVIAQLADLHEAMTMAVGPVPVPGDGADPAVREFWQAALAETIAAIESGATVAAKAFPLSPDDGEPAAAIRLFLYRLLLSGGPLRRLFPVVDVEASAPRVWTVGFLDADDRRRHPPTGW